MTQNGQTLVRISQKQANKRNRRGSQDSNHADTILKEVQSGEDKIEQNPQNQNNQDSAINKLLSFCRSRKIQLGGGILGIIGVAVIVMILIMILNTAITIGKLVSNNIHITSPNDDQLNQKIITDIKEESYTIKGKDEIQKHVVVTTIQKTIPGRVNRLLQQNNKTIEIHLIASSLVVRCSITGTTVKITSQNLDAVITPKINTILELLIKIHDASHKKVQKTQTKNLQEGESDIQNAQPSTDNTRTIQYYDVFSLTKSLLQKDYSDARVTLERISEKKFNEATQTFEPVVSSQNKEKINESSPLISLSDIPIVKDLSDERQIAKAIVLVVKTIVANTKKFISQSLQKIQSESDVTLPQTDENTLSIFADQPRDIQRLCTVVDVKENILQCTDVGWASGVLPVSQTPQTQSYALAISTVI